jgi:hypothetical protein
MKMEGKREVEKVVEEGAMVVVVADIDGRSI